MKSVEPISKSLVLEIHHQKIIRYGGMAGVRDEDLLEAALAQPWQSFAGIELYSSLPEKAARLGFEVISQHPFVDGNKRTGAALVAILLRANGSTFKPRSDAFYEAVVGVADGSLDYKGFLDFVLKSL